MAPVHHSAADIENVVIVCYKLWRHRGFTVTVPVM